MELIDEHLFSEINDPALAEIMAPIYGCSPVWIGGHYPKTSCDKLEPYAKHNSDPYRIYRDFIRDEVEFNGKVLDVGSASGAQSRLLARYFTEVVGIERAEEKFLFAEKYNAAENIRYIRDAVPAVRDIGKFVYVFCVSVLYQNAGNADIVKYLHGLLEPGGKLFIYNPATGESDVASWGLGAKKLAGDFETCPSGRFVINAG